MDRDDYAVRVARRHGDVSPTVVTSYGRDGDGERGPDERNEHRLRRRGRTPMRCGRRLRMATGRPRLRVYRPSTGDWWTRGLRPLRGAQPRRAGPRRLRRQTDADIAVYDHQPASGGCEPGHGDVGHSRRLAVPGDYDGNGTTDIAVYRPSTASVWVPNQFTVTWGAAGDVPVPATTTAKGRRTSPSTAPTGEWWCETIHRDVGAAGHVRCPATTTARHDRHRV